MLKSSRFLNNTIPVLLYLFKVVIHNNPRAWYVTQTSMKYQASQIFDMFEHSPWWWVGTSNGTADHTHIQSLKCWWSFQCQQWIWSLLYPQYSLPYYTLASFGFKVLQFMSLSAEAWFCFSSPWEAHAEVCSPSKEVYPFHNPACHGQFLTKPFNGGPSSHVSSLCFPLSRFQYISSFKSKNCKKDYISR